MTDEHATNKPRRISFVQVLIFTLLIAIFVLLLVPIRSMYESAIEQSGETLVLRVMDTLLEYQIDFKRENGEFAVGTFDSSEGVRSISEQTGWVPSLDEGIEYRVERISSDRYRVIALLPDQTSVCRIYPDKTNC